MKLKTSGFFPSAHFLDNYEGKCQNIHGHTYAYYIEVEGKELYDDMLIDFGILKELDHSFMVNVNSLFYKSCKDILLDYRVILFNCNPTAERIASRIKQLIKQKNPSLKHIKVRIWEDIKSLVDVRDLEEGSGEFIEV